MTFIKVLPSGSFDDPDIKPLLEQYRQTVAQRYTPCAPADLPRLLAAPPYFVSRKFDGELWFLIVSESIHLVAANGRVAVGSLAFLKDAARLPQGTILVGELHADTTKGRERVGDVLAALSQSSDQLEFSVFDIVQTPEMTWRDSTYPQRVEALRTLLHNSSAPQMIPVLETSSEQDIFGLYQDIVEGEGAEGLIVRCSDGRALKVKPERTIDCAVLGFTQRSGVSGEPEVRSLLLGLASPTGEAFTVVGTVGNFSDGVSRTDSLALVTPLVCDSQFRQAASTGQLYSMIQPQYLVECQVLDIQVENSKGLPIRRPRIRFNNGTWLIDGNLPAASINNAVAVRFREDKANVRDGARWDQIADVALGEGSTEATHPASEIVQRRVWTKSTKEKTDVRKLVVWKTNKELIDPSFPAFVVQWTDYSSGRKSPLNREVRPAPSQDVAGRIAEDLIEANIKKGWTEVLES